MSLKKDDASSKITYLKKKIFELQQQAYEQEEIFDFIQTLYHVKIELELLENEDKINKKNSLNFYEVKNVL